jgi:hypothetical protein
MSCVSRRQGRTAWCLPARIAARDWRRLPTQYVPTAVRQMAARWTPPAPAMRITVLARSTPQARGVPLRYAPTGDFRLRAVIRRRGRDGERFRMYRHACGASNRERDEDVELEETAQEERILRRWLSYGRLSMRGTAGDHFNSSILCAAFIAFAPMKPW